MKRFLILPILLLASAAFAIDNPITNGILTTNLNANSKQITSLDVTNLPLQPINGNLTAIANGGGVSATAVTLLAQPDAASMRTVLGVSNNGTFVQDRPAVGGQFVTGFVQSTGAWLTSAVGWADVTGKPNLPANTSSVSHQVLNSYNSTTGAFTQIQLAFPDISGAATAGQLPALNALTAPTGDLSMASHKITNVTAPTNPGDAAIKSYVDTSVSSGIPPPHPSVAAASTANVASLSGETTIDGVTTLTSRVLLKNQSTASQNGIYVTAAGAWSRATDSDVGTEMPGGIFVSAGTANANTGWAVSNAQPINVGVDSLTYVQISSIPPSHSPVTITGQNYVTLDQPNQILTISPVDVSGTNITGVLAAVNHPALTGDVTTSSGSVSTSIASGAVTNAKLAQMAATSIKGNKTGGTAAPTDLNASDAKTLLSLNNVENTALSTWAGSTNLVTLGTVATGTWNATAISIAKGGTGASTAAVALGNLLPAGSNGQVLVRTGASTQALKSIYRVISVQVLTSGTTYTTASGATDIFVECIGSGGGGAGANGSGASQAAGGAGGGGGAYAAKWISSPSASYSYVIGAGGAGGTAGNNTGSIGTATTFGTGPLVSAGSGGGGNPMAGGGVTATFSDPASGGVFITGDYGFSGSDGSHGIRLSGTSCLAGDGGASAKSGSTKGRFLEAAGSNGKIYGGGGAGADSLSNTALAGGSGANGIIIVTEYSATIAP